MPRDQKIRTPICWEVLKSPLGDLFFAATETGLFLLQLGVSREAFLSGLSARGFECIERGGLARARQQLESYFRSSQSDFSLPIDWSEYTAFQKAVLFEAQRIPPGQTKTYGEIAAALGKPGAARGVGAALARNRVPIIVPCHRVVGAKGAMTGYSGGLETKRLLLAWERGEKSFHTPA